MAKTISFSFLFILSSTELKETLLSALWFLLHKIGLKGVTSCQFCARSGSDHCLGLYTDLRMSHFSSGSCYSVQFSCSVVSDFLQPHGLQHARPPYHQLPEPAQTHVHRISDAIQPSHPPSSPSSPAFNLSRHQGLFQ